MNSRTGSRITHPTDFAMVYSGGGNEFEHNEKLVAYMIAERPVRTCAVLIQMAEGEKIFIRFLF